MVKAPMPVITMIVKKVKMMRWRNMDNKNKAKSNNWVKPVWKFQTGME